jgi:hypothetical protein
MSILTRNLDALGNSFSVPLRPDEKGFLGRECPNLKCEGYFKLKPGTGLPGKDLPCHCPYCGTTEGTNKFFTKEQIEYAKSVVLARVTEAVAKDLKGLEFSQAPVGPFGLGISMKIEAKPVPIFRYREKRLETEVVCDKCTLEYAIYGAFGFCPDCRAHNSRQILGKNLDLCEKLLDVAATLDGELGQHLVDNALEDCVSAFDGFGRETCRVFASKAKEPAKAESVSIQNIAGARKRILDLFGLDFAAGLTPDEWRKVRFAFEKRHLLAHKMRVIDQEYLDATGEPSAKLGKFVSIAAAEVSELMDQLRVLGAGLYDQLAKIP